MGLVNFFERIRRKSSNSRIAINTAVLYFQRISVGLFSLITTPILLKSLGVEDYGLFTLLIGVVGMLAFVNWSLSSTTQRYISFSVGEGDTERVKVVFITSFCIHLAFGIILLGLVFKGGGYLLHNYLEIPIERKSIARILVSIVAVITFFNIITVPIIGIFRANENFLFLALSGILESSIKLAIAVSLLFLTGDKLLIYTSLLCVLTVLISLLNFFVAKWLYEEVNFNISLIKSSLVKEMISFILWSLLGALAILSRNQGVSVLLNMFFGVVANAAYGISYQVRYALGILGQAIIGSISPQLVKNAGSKDFDKMIYLMRNMSKFSVLSVSTFAIPFLIEAPYLLKLWLQDVPENTVLFSRLMIFFGLTTAMSAGIETVFSAIGKVKTYNIVVSLILLLNIPISYLLFQRSFPSYYILIVGITLEWISFFVRVILLKKYLDFSMNVFFIDVLRGIIFPISLALFVAIFLRGLIEIAFAQVIITVASFSMVYVPLIYLLALDKVQKEYMNLAWSKLKVRFTNSF